MNRNTDNNASFGSSPAGPVRPVQTRGAGRPVQGRGASRPAQGRNASRPQAGARPAARNTGYPGAPGSPQGAPATFGQSASSYDRSRYGHGGSRGAGGSHHGGKGGGKGRGIALKVVMVLACIVLVASLGVLAFIGFSYWQGTKTYDDIASQAFKEPDTDSLANMTVDWDLLAEKNGDVVGWVYVPGTTISYPIVQGESDDEYLKTDFTGATNPIVHKGSIFLSQENAPDFADDACYIFGHNMNDDTMFGPLMDMLDQPAFDAARTVYILTPEMNYRCQTYAIDVVPSTATSILQPHFADTATRTAYINDRIADSKVARPGDVDPAAYSKLFAFITCGDDYANTRAILFAGAVETAVPVGDSGSIVVDNGGASISGTGASDEASDEASDSAGQ